MMYQSRRPHYNTQSLRSAAPKRVTRKEIVTIIIIALVAAVLLLIFFEQHHRSKAATKGVSSAAVKSASSQQDNTNPTPSQPAGFNKQQYSLTQASSLWAVVNKKQALNPLNYAPSDLVVPSIPLRSNITGDEKYVSNKMAPALQKMVSDAAGAGVHLNLQSGYRSYNFQTSLYNSYVKQQGQAAADRQSARAGHSEHQTGLAADLGGTSQPGCNVAQCFANTTEGQWLAANSYKYGFIIRYPSDKESITGYEYEPWHVRYVGVDLATEMHNQGVKTLEEFFGVPGGTSY
jgi:zinc D-Ala-D-Ala carboxypeptidase